MDPASSRRRLHHSRSLPSPHHPTRSVQLAPAHGGATHPDVVVWLLDSVCVVTSPYQHVLDADWLGSPIKRPFPFPFSLMVVRSTTVGRQSLWGTTVTGEKPRQF